MVGGKFLPKKGPNTNYTEIIDPIADMPMCNDTTPFPSKSARYGMVGAYLGNASTMFCGGTNADHSGGHGVQDDCVG